MSKNRVTYQAQGAFIGPAIISGSHNTNKDPYSIERIQALTYSFNIDRADIVQLGKMGLVTRPIIEHPTVDIELTYLQASFTNEEAIGFNFNLQSGVYGEPQRTGNFECSLISGFTNTGDRNLDRKNIYVTVQEREGIDAFNHLSGSGYWDPNERTDVIGISNCFLHRYSSRGAIGSPIENSISFQGSDINYFKSMELSLDPVKMPVVNYKDTTGLLEKEVWIEPYTATGETTILKPGDISIDLEQIKTNPTGGSNIGISLNEMKLQGYTIEISLNREKLRGIGFKVPIDYPIVEPATATIALEALVSDAEAGSLAEIRNYDDEYNIDVNIFKSTYCPTGEGDPEVVSYLTNAFMFRRAKLERANFNSDLGSSKNVSLGFMVDLDNEDMTKGLFLSGQVNP